jgi:hypothetical protein
VLKTSAVVLCVNALDLNQALGFRPRADVLPRVGFPVQSELQIPDLLLRVLQLKVELGIVGLVDLVVAVRRC